ncbi:MAG: hypothetical protein Q4C50_13160, partial [Eubacteriales bacterium]|nr:hypothetical protein [Eubacteriales bacterium]
TTIKQQQQLINEIAKAMKEIVGCVEYERVCLADDASEQGAPADCECPLSDEFYRNILDRVVVNDKDHIDVYLNLLPMKWSYAAAKASKKR